MLPTVMSRPSVAAAVSRENSDLPEHRTKSRIVHDFRALARTLHQTGSGRCAESSAIVPGRIGLFGADYEVLAGGPKITRRITFMRPKCSHRCLLPREFDAQVGPSDA